MTAREVEERRKLILPVWHGVDAAFLNRVAPNLADKKSVTTGIGIPRVARAIVGAIERKLGHTIFEDNREALPDLSDEARSTLELFESERQNGGFMEASLRKIQMNTTGLSPAQISEALGALTARGLINTRQEGRTTFYSLAWVRDADSVQ